MPGPYTRPPCPRCASGSSALGSARRTRGCASGGSSPPARPRREGRPAPADGSDQVLFVRHAYGDRREWQLPGGGPWAGRGRGGRGRAARCTRSSASASTSCARSATCRRPAPQDRHAALLRRARRPGALRVRWAEIEEVRWAPPDRPPQPIGKDVRRSSRSRSVPRVRRGTYSIVAATRDRRARRRRAVALVRRRRRSCLGPAPGVGAVVHPVGRRARPTARGCSSALAAGAGAPRRCARRAGADDEPRVRQVGVVDAARRRRRCTPARAASPSPATTTGAGFARAGQHDGLARRCGRRDGRAPTRAAAARWRGACSAALDAAEAAGRRRPRPPVGGAAWSRPPRASRGGARVDLRVDDHPEPLAELGRLLDLSDAYDAGHRGRRARRRRAATRRPASATPRRRARARQPRAAVLGRPGRRAGRATPSGARARARGDRRCTRAGRDAARPRCSRDIAPARAGRQRALTDAAERALALARRLRGYSETGIDRSSAVRMIRFCSAVWAAG